MLSYLALVVIFLIVIGIAVVIVVIGSLPGKIARKRNHPYPDAVNAASWIGLATGVGWPLAFVWAFLPVPARASEPQTGTVHADVDVLQRRVAELETSLTRLQEQQAGAAG